MKSPLAWLTFGLLSVHAALAAAPAEAEVKEDVTKPGQSPNFQVQITTHFPNSEVFGVKLVNGRQSEAVLSIANMEPNPVSLRFIGGSFAALETGAKTPGQLLRNLTTTGYKAEPVPAGQKASYTYKFTTNMHPTDLQLRLVAVIADEAGALYTMQAFNGTVTIVEAPVSLFDPQILFLYLILGAAFAGTSYFIYTTWFGTLFPQKRRGGRGGERAKTPSRGTKKVDPAEQASAGADGPAVTSSTQTFDSSWIPSHHLQRPEAKRIRSGTPSGVKTKSRQA